MTDKEDEEVERWMLKYGQQRARNAVFMQALATLARRGDADFAKKTIKRADDAAADVRVEDFTRAHVNAAPTSDWPSPVVAYMEGLREGAQKERERCAQVCDEIADTAGITRGVIVRTCARRIRHLKDKEMFKTEEERLAHNALAHQRAYEESFIIRVPGEPDTEYREWRYAEARWKATERGELWENIFGREFKLDWKGEP